MKIAVFTTFPFSQHWDVDQNLIDLYSKTENQVHAVTCGGGLMPCFFSACCGDNNICVSCNFSVDSFLSKYPQVKQTKINVTEKPYYNVTAEQEKLLRQAVLSLKISTNDNNYAFQWNAACDTDLLHAKKLYGEILRVFTEDRPDIVYLFNGSFWQYYSVLLACWSLKISTYAHDTHMLYDRVMFMKDSIMFSPVEVSYQASDLYTKSKLTEDEKLALAEEFYTRRLFGNQQGLVPVNFMQTNGSLPSGFDKLKTNILIAGSSMGEVISCPGINLWFDPKECDELCICETIAEQFPDYTFYYRAHPNLKNKEEHTQGFRTFKYQPRNKNLIIIKPDSPISSPAMVHECIATISFGGTVGIYATYIGKPSFNIGRSIVEMLDVQFNCDSLDLIVGYLKSMPTPKPKLGAIKYALWCLQGGFDNKLTGLIKEHLWRAL